VLSTSVIMNKKGSFPRQEGSGRKNKDDSQRNTDRPARSSKRYTGDNSRDNTKDTDGAGERPERRRKYNEQRTSDARPFRSREDQPTASGRGPRERSNNRNNERDGARSENRPEGRRHFSRPRSADARPFKPREPRSSEPGDERKERSNKRNTDRDRTSSEGRPDGDRQYSRPRNTDTRQFKPREPRSSEQGDERKERSNKRNTDRDRTSSEGRPDGDRQYSRPRNTDSRPFRLREQRPSEPVEEQKKKVIPKSTDSKRAIPPAAGKKGAKEIVPENMPLNKYIAHSGECSRRDAAELVRQGKVKVNGELILDPGHKVLSTDKITLNGKKLMLQKGMVYLLLNKPKGFITTNDDPQGRKTVMDLVSNSGFDRLFPVGRLDRNTSGLLLITNDGALTQKLSHPSYNIKKVYHVTLDKPLTKADFEKVAAGVVLEDGPAPVDAIAYLEAKNELGLEIHSGKNRIVRRIFESLGYVVDKLDRVMYAGLTKKNLPRGKWRLLDDREVVLLKHFKN
jgi:23S rRNA pseudouridine2605 synthase